MFFLFYPKMVNIKTITRNTETCMFLKQNPSCFSCFIQYGKQHKNHNGKCYKHTCFLRKTHYGFQILTVCGFYPKNINGKSSAFPLMVLTMGFSKIQSLYMIVHVIFICKVTCTCNTGKLFMKQNLEYNNYLLFQAWYLNNTTATTTALQIVYYMYSVP